MTKTRWMEHEDASNRDIRDEILRLLLMLKPGESICATDAARAFGHKWREMMPAVREVAVEMVRDGALEITQNGEIVDIEQRPIESVKGPIRLKLPPKL